MNSCIVFVDGIGHVEPLIDVGEDYDNYDDMFKEGIELFLYVIDSETWYSYRIIKDTQISIWSMIEKEKVPSELRAKALLFQ